MADLFGYEEFDWRKEWQGMPEFFQEDLMPYRVLNLRFRCEEDVQEFAKLMEQVITGQQPMDRVQMTLLIFRLKALRPMYRDRVALEHTGADGGAIKVENAGDSQRGMQMLTSWGNRLKSN